MMKKTKKKGNRTGFSTGACAAAAARACAEGLLSGQVPEKIEAKIPNGQRVSFNMIDCAVNGQQAEAATIKDGGDDPDCTHGAHITVNLRLLPGAKDEIHLKGGEGVGTVTLAGLGLEVGGPAINPVPRKNIEENIRAVASSLLLENGLEVTVSVPGGERMARKTINARLGILGGISILGTTGIVRPYSTAAFRASVIQGIEVASFQGQETIVLTTGGRTEKFVMRELPHLAPSCFVQMGDFLSYALDTAVKEKIKTVIIGGMAGKLTKMAQGETITHAGRNPVNTDLLAELAQNCGANKAACEEIREAQTARFAAERMEALGLVETFYHALAERVIQTLSERYPNQFNLQVLVCDFDGNKIADATGNSYEPTSL
jgi:cobalt-precorrin-5B (C1)-methyltransferase